MPSKALESLEAVTGESPQGHRVTTRSPQGHYRVCNLDCMQVEDLAIARSHNLEHRGLCYRWLGKTGVAKVGPGEYGDKGRCSVYRW